MTRSSGVLLLTAVLLAAGGHPAAKDGGFSSAVELLRSDADEVVLRARFEPPRPRPGAPEGTAWTVPGLADTDPVGDAVLPFRSVLVAIPPAAGWELIVETAPGSRLPAAAAGASSAGEPVVVDLDGYLRERRVLRVVFSPLLPDGDGARFLPSITARLVFHGDREGFAPAGAESIAPEDALSRRLRDGLYRTTILNEESVEPRSYETALRRSSGGARTRTEALQAAATTNVAAKIFVREEGIWSVTYDDLLAAGIDPGSPASADVSLTAGGVPVPRRVIDGGDGTFGPGDRVEFYGHGTPGNPNHDTETYRLAFGEGPGLAPATRAAAPAGGAVPVSFQHTARFEINEQLFTTVADGDGDRFGWARLIAPSSGSPAITRDFPSAAAGEPADLIHLTDLDPSATTVLVRMRAYHLGGTSHTTGIRLNGVDLMDDRTWTAPDVTHSASAAVATLLPANTVTMSLSGPSFNQILANWIEIEYPRQFKAADDTLIFSATLAAPVAHQVTGFTTSDIAVYDITDPAAPVRMESTSVSGGAGNFAVSFTDTVGGSRRFIARAGSAPPGGLILADQPSSLTDPANGADLIILSYRDFLADLAPLVAAREAQGLRVALVDVDDVYDEFSFGRLEPQAIRDFVTVAFQTWQPPAPAFLLLVGNATLDPRQLLSGSVPPLMPSGEFAAPSLGIASTDNFFVTVAGPDPLPDLALGRIPAQTSAEVADQVSRILAYDAIDPALLNGKVLFVADNDDPLFEAIQEDMVSLYLSGTRIPADRAYLRLLGTAATNQKIRDSFNAGALIVNYMGHGNIHNWAGENIFVDTTDIPALTNADRPAFVTTMNCINGLHAAPRAPNVSSMAEQLLLSPNGGAIGVWSPTALGTLVDYQKMSDALFRTLFTDRVQTLGLATTSAKVEAFTNQGVSSANLEEMTLFGDPTVVLRVDGDRDGLTDAEEDACACGLDPRDADVDDDGLLDGLEPTPLADTDGDGLIDVRDPDADDDGLPDGLEAGVATPDIDTDTGAGYFVADLDPLSGTDPRNADTDGGGAPDGAEDRDVDGAIGAGETDPQIAGDDAACGATPLPELQGLQVAVSGADLLLSWDGIEMQDPCVLYRVLDADVSGGSAPAFSALGVTTGPAVLLAGGASTPGLQAYLVVARRPGMADGPSGH